MSSVVSRVESFDRFFFNFIFFQQKKRRGVFFDAAVSCFIESCFWRICCSTFKRSSCTLSSMGTLASGLKSEVFVKDFFFFFFVANCKVTNRFGFLVATIRVIASNLSTTFCPEISLLGGQILIRIGLLDSTLSFGAPTTFLIQRPWWTTFTAWESE